MKCPRTGKAMVEVVVDGVTVDVSTGCGGVFFDNFEIDKFDEKDEKAGDALIKTMEKYKADAGPDKKLPCPKCESVIMQRHFFSVKRKAEIDECPQCGGLWLDAGELLTIRETYPTEEGREKAAEAFVQDAIDNNADFQKLKAEGEAGLAKARKFAHALRFICPSYYIKGKQSWGAF